MKSRLLTRTFQWVAVTVILGVVCTTTQAQKKTHIEEKTLTTNDGWSLKATYYKHAGKRNTPAVILLHSRQGDSRVWTSGFADNLWKEGFAVLAVDLRKHGESKMETSTGASSDVGDLKPDDYKRMVAFDMEAIKKFIFEEHQNQNLNMRKTGIVAPEMSAPIALNFAMLDWRKIPYDDAPVPQMRTPRGQDIRAMVLISPDNSVPGVSSTVPIRELKDPRKNIAFLFCVGDQDESKKNNTKKLYQQAKGRASKSSERIFLQSYPYKLQGMALIGKKLKIEADITVFLKKFLLELNDDWQDRRSRLQR